MHMHMHMHMYMCMYICLHCCKGDQLFLWRRAKLGYQNSETPEPIVTKFGMGDYVGDMTQQTKIQTDRSSGGVPANGRSITLAWFLFFCDHNFCSRPETKLENRFLRGLIHRMSIPGNWFPRGIKLQKVSDFPNLYHCTKFRAKWAWIGIFKLNAQNIKTCILSKPLSQFKPNFAQWQRPPKYTSWVVQPSV